MSGARPIELRWRDLQDDAEHWYGLAVDVLPHTDTARKPALRLETGDNQRIRLMQGTTPLLWATVQRSYYGAHLLKSFATFAPPIAPEALTSQIVQQHSALDAALRLPAWSRFFAQTLATSRSAFLYPAQWCFYGVQPRPKAWTFSDVHNLPNMGNIQATLGTTPVSAVDWSMNHGHSTIISLKTPYPLDDGG